MATRQSTAIVQSVFESSIREINALEQRIVEAEDDADAKLWEQAQRVAEQLDAGLSQRKLAAQWINARTGEPYSQSHVRNTVAVVAEYLTTQPRPRFRDAYNEVANAQPLQPHATSSQSNEWYTPKPYIASVRKVLGVINLDPATCDRANETVQAESIFTAEDSGLNHEWWGRIFLNPPYGDLAGKFVTKLVEESKAGRVESAILLINAHAAENGWFQPLWDHLICFTNHRIDYDAPEGVEKSTSTHGSVFVYFGDDLDRFADEFAQWGTVVQRYERAS